jgi:ATP-dependent Clp protease adaptor protein ClpS
MSKSLERRGDVKTVPLKPKRKPLPPWRVLLHNDEVNEMLYVVQAIVSLTPLPLRDAAAKMLEAHKRGLSLLLTTHQERAELYVQQFASCNLIVTIEPAN